MALEAPGVGRERGQQWGVGSHVFAGVIAEIIALDFRIFVEGTIGNLLGISRGMFLSAIFLGLLGALWSLIPNLPLFIFAWIVGTMPLWVLPAAVAGAWKAWVWYVQSNYLSKSEPILLVMQ